MISPRFFLHSARIADAVLFWPVLLSVIWGELSAQPDLGYLRLLFRMVGDKSVHFVAYFLLAAMAGMALKSRKAVLLAVAGLIVLGGVLEILESFVGRDMELADELANAAGALSGAFLARLIVEPLRRRFPQA